MKAVIYFICTKNHCRSLMAEGFAKHYFGDDFEIYSGGMTPREIPEETFTVMKERCVCFRLKKLKVFYLIKWTF